MKFILLELCLLVLFCYSLADVVSGDSTNTDSSRRNVSVDEELQVTNVSRNFQENMQALQSFAESTIESFRSLVRDAMNELQALAQNTTLIIRNYNQTRDLTDDQNTNESLSQQFSEQGNSILSRIQSQAQNTFETIQNRGRETIESIQSRAQEVFPNVASNIQDSFQNIQSQLQSIPSRIEEAQQAFQSQAQSVISEARQQPFSPSDVFEKMGFRKKRTVQSTEKCNTPCEPGPPGLIGLSGLPGITGRPGLPGLKGTPSLTNAEILAIIDAAIAERCPHGCNNGPRTN